MLVKTCEEASGSRSGCWYVAQGTAKVKPKPPLECDVQRARALLRKYGITTEQYEAMLVKQGGVCAICARPPQTRRLAVDHDHGPSKRVRGLVCQHCNRFKIAKNTLASAREVVKYLKRKFDGRLL